MAARSKARKRAVDLLYEADQRKIDVRALMGSRREDPEAPVGIPAFTVELVDGVVEHWASIDEALATWSQGWSVDRMPAVDRAILRLGVYEIVWSEDVPDAVAISEAVALASALSTDDSPDFVSGLLSRISQMKATVL
ncbi:NusB antitermination factor [Kytococcus aerolatus]|uniref:Transcription antitermination protein NusB n=1 Tax=Kytococcus aerolatus TaxID=592308 RepID=A0A212T053_9MICO|nr:transcription antitermination factor NusB [Kytococcus aerolatus]SNC59250.1 NusB antitermination factor [Kytococcus aerolatus]